MIESKKGDYLQHAPLVQSEGDRRSPCLSPLHPMERMDTKKMKSQFKGYGKGVNGCNGSSAGLESITTGTFLNSRGQFIDEVECRWRDPVRPAQTQKL